MTQALLKSVLVCTNRVDPKEMESEGICSPAATPAALPQRLCTFFIILRLRRDEMITSISFLAPDPLFQASLFLSFYHCFSVIILIFIYLFDFLLRNLPRLSWFWQPSQSADRFSADPPSLSFHKFRESSRDMAQLPSKLPFSKKRLRARVIISYAVSSKLC